MNTKPGRRAYGSVFLLAMGMVLMFLGFFAYLGGKIPSISIAIIVAGFASVFFGFVLGYLEYRTAIGR